MECWRNDRGADDWHFVEDDWTGKENELKLLLLEDLLRI